MDTLGTRLRHARLSLSMTQQQVSDAMGRAGRPIDVSFVSYMESDRNKPSIETLAALAVVLNVDERYLMEPLRAATLPVIPESKDERSRYEEMLNDTESTQIGERIRNIRHEKNMTLAELAHHVGVTKGAIYQYEYGKCKPSINTMLALSAALGVSVEHLTEPLQVERNAN